MLTQIETVTTSDLNRVGEKYVSALFDPTKTRTAVVTDPTKSAEIAAEFKE